MNVIIFGATGMVGQGALRECLLDPDVERVFCVGRSLSGQRHEKLREFAQPDLRDLSAIDSALSGFHACFYCLGASAAGMSEDRYTRVTYDLTLAVARTLAPRNPELTFIYVSGTGTDSTERGRVMWARVKGRTENALLAFGFKAAYMFRPAVILPMHGAKSRTTLYRVAYAMMTPFMPLVRAAFPKYVTTTEAVARAMLRVAREGYPTPILENADIIEAGR
jgi:uncharacterized protein YbjT (DUF2867 family)